MADDTYTLATGSTLDFDLSNSDSYTLTTGSTLDFDLTSITPVDTITYRDSTDTTVNIKVYDPSDISSRLRIYTNGQTCVFAVASDPSNADTDLRFYDEGSIKGIKTEAS